MDQESGNHINKEPSREEESQRKEVLLIEPHLRSNPIEQGAKSSGQKSHPHLRSNPNGGSLTPERKEGNQQQRGDGNQVIGENGEPIAMKRPHYGFEDYKQNIIKRVREEQQKRSENQQEKLVDNTNKSS